MGGFLVVACLALGGSPVAAQSLADRSIASVSSQDLAASPPAFSALGLFAASNVAASTNPTGFTVAATFQSFYDQSGGLPVFGYPIGPPVLERAQLAQYFERQRFEAHPEHTGTPYAVELGRLGYDNAQSGNLLATLPFQPVDAPAPSSPNCQFFPQTGHSLCNGFRDYWHAHGLDFGDPGISDRESLALFGYPISQEFQQNGVTVQYFERARFEYHPENPAPYDIELGLLGHAGWAAAAPNDRPAPAPSLGAQIAATAMKYLGAPYAWGGTSPSGFDCSGFVYFVANQVTGGGFPRDMASQAAAGVQVDPSDLQPGDLVFQQNTYQWGLSHAGIYLGNGQFISAENPGTGVAIANLWDSYWGPRFYTARRLTP